MVLSVVYLGKQTSSKVCNLCCSRVPDVLRDNFRIPSLQ